MTTFDSIDSTTNSTPDPTPLESAPALRVGRFELRSRLVAGTGKYPDAATMQSALAASGCDAVTVAVRRERLVNAEGRSLLEDLDLDRLTVLPNTAGCFTAEDAVRVARLGRELLEPKAESQLMPPRAQQQP